MDKSLIIKKFKEKYPGKKILLNPENDPTEIICEVEPTEDHFEYSKAIAVIFSSKSHKHKVTEETYKVIKGKLNLFVEDKKYTLKKGDVFTIKPPKNHRVESKNGAWVEVTSKPGWTSKDHYLI